MWVSEFCVFWCPEWTFSLVRAEVKRNLVPFFKAGNMMYPVYRTRGREPNACKRPTLFCSSDQLAHQQSGQSKEACPTELSPVFKKGPAVLMQRPHLWPKIEATSLGPLQDLRPVCSAGAYLEKSAALCGGPKRHLCTRARVCKHCAGWKESLLTFGPQAQTGMETMAIKMSHVWRADERGKQALPSLMSTNIWWGQKGKENTHSCHAKPG